MIKGSPKQLVLDLLRRSTCNVQVAAVVADHQGLIFGWGWNSSGPTGMGEHAEAACLRRCNRRRLGAATIYIAARRLRNGKIVTAKPCGECRIKCQKVPVVIYRDGEGIWVRENDRA